MQKIITAVLALLLVPALVFASGSVYTNSGGHQGVVTLYQGYTIALPMLFLITSLIVSLVSARRVRGGKRSK